MKLLSDFKNYLFGYSFVEPLAPGESYSTNLKIQRNLDKSLWAAKISNALPVVIPNFRKTGKPYIRTVDFRDLDERAMLGFRLARKAGLKSLKTKIIPAKYVSNFDINSVGHARINDNIFLSEFKGQSLAKYLRQNSFPDFEASDIQNKDEVIRSFVFNLWIGNYDNKDRDYLVDENKNLISIDYHLLGPGFKSDPKLALGAWGEAFDMQNSADTGWCIGDGQLLNYLRKNVNNWLPFQETIEKINAIPKFQIRYAMRGLNFYNQGTQQNINDLFFNFLLDRRTKLENTIKSWINAGCPITSLPKDNCVV